MISIVLWARPLSSAQIILRCSHPQPINNILRNPCMWSQRRLLVGTSSGPEQVPAPTHGCRPLSYPSFQEHSSIARAPEVKAQCKAANNTPNALPDT